MLRQVILAVCLAACLGSRTQCAASIHSVISSLEPCRLAVGVGASSENGSPNRFPHNRGQEFQQGSEDAMQSSSAQRSSGASSSGGDLAVVRTAVFFSAPTPVGVVRDSPGLQSSRGFPAGVHEPPEFLAGLRA